MIDTTFYQNSNQPMRIADILMAQYTPVEETHVVPVSQTYTIQQPTTEEWYNRQRIIQQETMEQAKKLAEIELIQLITKKEMLKKKLGELDISKKKDAKKIITINTDLRYIEYQIQTIELQYGISATNVDQGTRLGRFIGKIKKTVKKIVKSVKRFWKRNFELIYGLAAIFLPVIGGFFLKKLFT